MSGSNGALAAGEKIQVSSDGGATWHDVTQAGTSWSYDDTANPHGSSFTYTARIVDTAGNIGTTTSQAITIDTTAPTETLAITAIATDTAIGGTNNDFITSDTTLVVSGSNGALAAGEKIQVSSDGGATWHDVTQAGTSWSYDDTANPHGSSFTYTARIVDTAGNIGTTTSQAITIDTTAPAETLAITAIATDTAIGGTNNDFITSDTTLVVSGSNGALAAGEKIQVSSDGGATWHDVTQAGTSWSYDDTANPHGSSFTYTARIVDAAGNIGTTTSQAITIDTTAPAETLAITAIATDTGTAGDFITSDTTLVVSGSNGALAAGEKIQVSSDGGATWHDVTQAGTSWSYDDTANPHGSSFTYTARIVDTAGNIGTTTSQAITIDTTAPAETLAITAIATDTAIGGTNNDFITSDTTLVVSGSNGALAAGEKIQVSSDGVTWHDVTQAGTSWSYDDTANPHGSSFTYTARIVDAAGNIGSTTSQAITIDTTAPAETLAITAIATDTGTAGDFITSDTTLVVSGSNGALAAGEKIQVSSDGGATWHDVTQAGTSWSYDDTANPHGSSFTYTARIVDTAGNIGTTTSQAITIDTTAPTETLAITAIATDTAIGGTNNDFITSDTTLVVSGSNGALAAGEKIQVSSDGGATWHDVTQAGTSWSYDDTANPHGSSFTYTARIVDAAGNIGTTTSQAITIDTTLPAETLAITAIATDTAVGGTNNDFITSDTTLIVSGSNGALAAGEKIQVSSDGGATWHDVTQAGTSWSYDDTANPHGSSFTYTARIVDAAGNIGTTTSQAITIDTTAPAETLAITAIATDTAIGGTNNDFITSDTTLVVSGSNGALAAGEKIQVSSDGVTWHDVTQAGTSWSYDDTANPHGSSFTYTARIVDTAGNIGSTTSQAITIDTTAPGVTFDTVSFTDTGVQGDHITANGQVTLSGTVSDNVTVSQVQVFNGSQLLGTATVDNVHHIWTLTTTLAPGAYNQFNATATDEAGNSANATTTQTVQVNDAPVLTPIGPTLTAITEDQTSNVSDPGQTVSSFIGASISDVDAGAVKGIAITGLTSTNGTWQYSIDSGTTWTAIGAVSNSTALLLDASDKIRFLPDGNNGGSDSITYRAWDETTGSHGTTADTSANGGTTAFSTATDTAHLTVASVNDAPVATITPTTYGATEQTSLSLKNNGLAVSDVDSLGGVEKVTLSVTEGTLTVTAGTSGATVSGSGSKSVAITGTLAQINALLNTDGTSTVSYVDNTYNPAPSAALTLSINDNGNTGSGGALTGSDTATINITPVVSAATYMTFNGSTQNNLAEIDTNGGSVRITLTFSGAVHFSGGNPTLSIADGDEIPPGSDDDTATYNASFSNPTHGVLVFTFPADFRRTNARSRDHRGQWDDTRHHQR